MLRKTWEKSVRTLASTVMVIAAAQLLLAAPGEADTLDAPTGLHVSTTNGSAIPTFHWDRVPGATSYQVQASTSITFGSTVVNTSTANTQYIPTVPLPAGTIYWQVSAKSSSTSSGFAQDSYSATGPAAPTLLAPADNTSTLDYASDPNALVAPETPLILKWSPVQGATKYDVQISTDKTFTGATTQTTQTTKLATPSGLLADGRYYWRVQAEWSSTIVSGYSDYYSFTINSHADAAADPVAPVTSDPDGPKVTDVALAWHPVPGATTYTLQVSTDRQFLDSSANVATVGGITGTRYSPPTTWNNDQYYWRVQGYDASSNPLGWSTTWQFQRHWTDGFGTTYPADGADVTDPAQTFFQWDAVPHASQYTLTISTHSDLSDARTCTTTNTTFTPYLSGNNKGCALTSGKQYWWFVSATDGASGSATGPVTESAVQPVHSFTYDVPTTGGGEPRSVTSGVVAALRGSALNSPAATDHCDPMILPDGCQDLPSTPVLSWPSQDGASSYLVQVYHDRAMTNIYSSYSEVVQAPVWSAPVQMADSQAGQAYYVHITACPSTSSCPRLTDITQANIGFNITSDALQLCGVTTDHTGPAPDNDPDYTHPTACETQHDTNVGSPDGLTLTTDDNVTFHWSDYLLTTQSAAPDASVTGGPGTEARYYRIQVSTNSQFTSLLDDAKVDQTTFTSTTKTYPDGPIYWRVQAYDGSANPLSWSGYPNDPAHVASFTKASVPPEPLSPADGATDVDIAPTLSWQAAHDTATGVRADQAKSYNIEVYKDDGNPFGASNRVLSKNTLQTAWAITTPLTAGATYAWRVARVDSSGRVSPWSPYQRFTVSSRGITLTSPADTAQLSPTSYVFAWEPVTGAVSYQFRLTGSDGSTKTQTTSALSWAPTSMPGNATQWSWCVIPLDAAGNSMASCPTTKPAFTYVSKPTAPSIDVEGKAVVDGTLTALEPTWNLTGVATTYQWYRGSVSTANAISGATEPNYQVVAADLNKKLIVVATGTKDGYDTGTVTSTAVTVGLGAAPTLAHLDVSGSGQVGATMSAAAYWNEGGVSTTFKWLRDNKAISRATNSTYTITTSDYGHQLTVQAKGTLDAQHGTTTETSNPIAVLAGDSLVATIQPSISGNPGIGARLYVNRGTWTNSPTKYAYRWQRNGVNIAGATSPSYSATKADVGKRLRVVVTATRTGYGDGQAASAAVFVPKVVPTMLTRLSPYRVKVHTRAGVLVTLYTGRLSGPTGTLQVFVNGHKRVAKKLTAKALGKVTIKLPKLKKGTYKVQVRYLGSTYTTAKRSSKMTLSVYK